MPELDDGSRRYKCPSCSRSFKRSEHCRRHSRRHTQERPYACRYCDRRYSRRDLATRHEKTLHVDQYSPPERTLQHSPSTGAVTSSPDSPPAGSAPSPQGSQVVARPESRVSIAARSQHAEDMSGGQAWTALLGLDGFDPFANDGSVNGFPLPGISMADDFHLAEMNFPMPTEPSAHHQASNLVADVNAQVNLEGSRQWLTPISMTEVHGRTPQSTLPPIPSIGPKVIPVRISDAVLSSLRDSLGEEERQRPTTSALRLFLGTYFDVFNVHLPLLHAPSFDCDHQPMGLLLAMAAIGALYRLEHRSATLLYWAADVAAPVGARPSQMETLQQDTSSESQGSQSGEKSKCLRYYQTRLLLHYFGIFGGDSELADRSLGMIAELALSLYRNLSRQLKTSGGAEERDATWTSWLRWESTKRTLCGAWIIGDFVSSIYGTPPPFTVGQDGQLELPCSEALWQAKSETEWNDARLAESDRGNDSTTTIRDAFVQLVDNIDHQSPNPTALKWSPFAVVCVMHILSTRFWHVSHGTLPASSSGGGGNNNSSGTIPKLFLTAARRCHDFLAEYSDYIEQFSATWRTKDASWQLHNAADVLRVCYSRTVPALARLDCDTMLRGGADEVRVAIEEYVQMPLERSAELTLAVGIAFEGLCVPLRHGSQLYRRTGALTGSLEHLVGGWDGGMLVSKWIHVVCGARALGAELDGDEVELLQRIHDTLQREEAELDEGSPLAARLLRHWASFYDTTWVWGVAPRMAVVFRKMASAYQSGYVV